MEVGNFIKLGFNKNEALVFLSLLKFGKADANQLIKDTKFHKNIIYDNLEKLMNKGLIAFITEKGRRVFSAESSDKLKDYFANKEEEFEKKKEISKEVAKEIEKLEKIIPEKQEASISRGTNAIKSFYYNEALKEKEYFIIGAPKEAIEIMGVHFWENHRARRKEKKIRVKMIFNQSIRYHGKTAEIKYNEIRYFEKDFEPLTETHIQEGVVAIILWAKEPLIFKIENRQIAESYKKYFEKIWKFSKK